MIIISDVIKRIIQNQKKRHWTNYQLSEISDVPQTTISSWYNKGRKPNLDTLEKICTAFDITLCQFFADEHEDFSLSPTQRELLDKWSLLTPEQQNAILNLMDTINSGKSSHPKPND